MNTIQAALYARVSSEAQAKDQTIQSQITALLEKAQTDGCPIPAVGQFVDDGFSGSTLVRPALERLRDQVATGMVDRLYVYAPDRLARKLAHQAVLVEEFMRARVEIVFLNRPLGNSPLDEFMLQLQGAFAEFERATTIERVRRGKRYAARKGAVSVLSGAPYGYRYLPKAQGDGMAHWEIVPDQAAVVRDLFDWVGRERLTLSGVVQRLESMGIPSPRGYSRWARGTIQQMVTNPAYVGRAAFGRIRRGPFKPKLRPAFGHLEYPRQGSSRKSTLGGVADHPGAGPGEPGCL